MKNPYNKINKDMGCVSSLKVTKYADFIGPSFPGCPFGSMIIGIQFLFFKHSISLFILL